jgi:hypothetical protein
MSAREGKKLVQVWMEDDHVDQMIDVCDISGLSRSDIIRDAFTMQSFDYLLDKDGKKKRRKLLRDLAGLELDVKRRRAERDRLDKIIKQKGG